jgi:hypothetical protein
VSDPLQVTESYGDADKIGTLGFPHGPEVSRSRREQVEQQGFRVDAARSDGGDESFGFGFFAPQHEIGQVLDVVRCGLRP